MVLHNVTFHITRVNFVLYSLNGKNNKGDNTYLVPVMWKALCYIPFGLIMRSINSKNCILIPFYRWGIEVQKVGQLEKAESCLIVTSFAICSMALVSQPAECCLILTLFSAFFLCVSSMVCNGSAGASS